MALRTVSLPSPGRLAALDCLRRLVYAGSAIVLDRDHDYLLETRLGPLLLREGLPDLEALVERLGRSDGFLLRQQVVDAMTTNETSFFRDVHPFEAMRKLVLPELARRGRGERSLRVWSAASSTGQELYSLAMLIRELGLLFDGWHVELLGSDISGEVLSRARAGRYTQLEVNRGLPAPLLVRHFRQEGAEWTASPELRRMTEFRRINLAEPWPLLPSMDVVFLRNVLIYFDMETKRSVLDRLVRVLKPGGYLFLGGVESTLRLCERFVPVHTERTTFYRLADAGA